MTVWWVVLSVATAAGLLVFAVRYQRNVNSENAHTLAAVTARRQQLGVDDIEDPRERRRLQLMRAEQAMPPEPPVRPEGAPEDWPHGFFSPYGPSDPTGETGGPVTDPGLSTDILDLDTPEERTP